MNSIFSKSYKILFVTLLIVGGFLFLGNINNASADVCYVCCCGNGQIVPAADCSVSCDGYGGVNGPSTPYICNGAIPSYEGTCAVADPCNGACGEGYTCDEWCNSTASGGGAEIACEPACDPDTEACVNGSCESLTSEEETCMSSCNGDSTCEEGCLYLGGGDANDILPGSGPTGNINNITPRTAGPAVRMLNLSGITSIQDLFAKIIAFITPLVMLFAGVMIIWSGFLFVTAQGDPSAITKAKQNFIWTVTGVAIILASGAIVDYVSGLLGGNSTGSGTALRNKIETILRDQIIPILFLLVTVYFFWGIITYVRAGGDQKAIDTGKQHMLWGIIGMAVMASAWGIVGVIASMVQ